MTERLYITIHDEFYDAAFSYDNTDGTGDLFETVATLPGGRWDWTEASVVEEDRADDPHLVYHIRALLTYMHEQRDIREKEDADEDEETIPEFLRRRADAICRALQPGWEAKARALHLAANELESRLDTPTPSKESCGHCDGCEHCEGDVI